MGQVWAGGTSVDWACWSARESWAKGPDSILYDSMTQENTNMSRPLGPSSLTHHSCTDTPQASSPMFIPHCPQSPQSSRNVLNCTLNTSNDLASPTLCERELQSFTNLVGRFFHTSIISIYTFLFLYTHFFCLFFLLSGAVQHFIFF